jgi:tetratricopeptide (TPR) repeat protein
MLRVMRAAALLAFLVCAAIAQDFTPEQLFRDAVEAQQRGDYERAVQKYQELIALRPDVLEARANLGAALVHLGRFDEAITQYESALAGNPGQLRIRMNLALAYYKAGRIGQAASEFATLHTGAPSEKRITLLLADCWLQQGENGKVIDLLAPLDADYHDDPAFSYLYGTALMRSDQMDKGQQVMDRILRNGDSAEARVLMATARLRRSDYLGAKEDLQRAIELNPTLPGIHSMYGSVLGSLMDSGAIAAYQEELEINPNDFVANLRLGVAALHDRQLDRAESYLRRALAVRPQDPGTLLQLANLLYAQNKRDEACRVLEDLTKRYPDFREAHVVLASAYYRLQRKADGDAESAIVRRLNAKQPAATAASPVSGSTAH